MSKYRIVFTPSRIRRYAFLLPVAVLAGNTLIYPPQVWSWVTPGQYALAIFMVAATLGIWQGVVYRTAAQVFSVAQDGSWQTLMIDGESIQTPACRLLRASLTTPLALYLVLDNPHTGTTRWWILKGECSEADFRRLARIIDGLQEVPKRDVLL